jgi:8-oxo-dGTP diphosphatase
MISTMKATPSKIVKSRDIHGNIYEVEADQLTWRPSAYAIVTNNKKILVVKEPNGYHLPGGGVEVGEDPKDTAVRETNEETGLQVANPKLVGTLSNFFTWHEQGEPQQFRHVQALLLYYICDFVGGDFSTAGHTEYEQAMNLKIEWLPLGKLNNVTVGTTVDWRPLVKKVVA